MGATCSTESSGCETQAGSCGTPAGSTIRCPGCGQASCSDPVSCGTAMWVSSFFQAMKAVQVDILKAKIQKAWGPMMEKAGDAALESMGVMWQSMQAQAKAKEDFRTKLQKVWQEGK